MHHHVHLKACNEIVISNVIISLTVWFGADEVLLLLAGVVVPRLVAVVVVADGQAVLGVAPVGLTLAPVGEPVSQLGVVLHPPNN